MAITLPKEARDKAIASIIQFCHDELDIDAGQMKATAILDFFLKELGPSVYNQAITEAKSYMERSAGDLDGACYEKEFSWRSTGGPSGKPK